MRVVIILIIAILGALFAASFGGGLGYAKGGGTIELLPKTVTASSESGQAIAVGWSEVENLNASNTAAPKPAPTRTFWDAAPLLGLAVAGLLVIGAIVSHIKPADDEWEADLDVQPHHSAKEAAEYQRRYS